ncbi:uncharacterized protein METZ01_LOCUS177188 [marine metagenome]|uniref:Uncharacterized protein n=1 Tax=marine metagenome TaxID=408172 RepID=A0A382CEP0_9ZZZZ
MKIVVRSRIIGLHPDYIMDVLENRKPS